VKRLERLGEPAYEFSDLVHPVDAPVNPESPGHVEFESWRDVSKSRFDIATTDGFELTPDDLNTVLGHLDSQYGGRSSYHSPRVRKACQNSRLGSSASSASSISGT
jgi:hypothetical protein